VAGTGCDQAGPLRIVCPPGRVARERDPDHTNADSYEGIIDQGIIERGRETSYVCAVADPPLISIVDDDESVREALWGLVRSVGFSVSTFASAEEFLNSDHFENVDCLILDVCMPGMGGIELQRQLVAGHCDVPVIFITAHEDEGMRSQALKGGAEAVLIKPFSEESLLGAIDAALSPR
jgi:CheY-like chemotaxis protein